MLQNTLNISACEQAERLYNLYQEFTLDLPYSDECDAMIEAVRAAYRNVLNELNDAGIGAVLINGTFRNTGRWE